MFNAQLLIVTRGTGIFILLVPIMITDLHIPKNTKPKFPDPRSRTYSILVSGSCFISSGLNRLRTLLSSRARMDSALILSLMDTAVKWTPSKPFDNFSGFLFRFFKIQARTMMMRKRVMTAAIVPAMAAVFDFVEDSVLGSSLGSAVVKSE